MRSSFLAAAPAAAALALILAAGSTAELPAGTDPLAPVSVELRPGEIPMAVHRNLGAATYLRSSGRTPPEGFDLVYEGLVGASRDPLTGLPAGGLRLRFLQKGWERGSLSFFWWPEKGEPVELPRSEHAISSYFLAFGPLRSEGAPPLSVHFGYPTRNVERWRALPRKMLYVLPLGCLEGAADLGGGPVRLALYDRNLNGTYTDPCREHQRQGDWMLLDRDGDGLFRLSSRSDEVLPVTEVLRIAGRWWKPSVSRAEDGSRSLTLAPAGLPCFSLRLEGLTGPCTVRGWSYRSGPFTGRTDGREPIRVPRGRYRLYSYILPSGDWTLTASLGRSGVRSAPGEGEEDRWQVGPPLRPELKVLRSRGPVRFSLRLLDRSGGAATLLRGGRRVQPVFTVTDAGGREVLRKAVGFG